MGIINDKLKWIVLDSPTHGTQVLSLQFNSGGTAQVFSREDDVAVVAIKLRHLAEKLERAAIEDEWHGR